MKKNKTKDFEVKFEDFKETEEQGVAEALLSKYNHIDRVGDMVMPGAYTKTIASKPKIPMLADHDMTKQIGILELFDTQEGLRIKMTFFLNTNLGREKFELTKASSEAGLPMGTSIGYRIKARSFVEIEGQQVRKLEEIALHEGSITAFPCCTPCLVDSVKSEDINVREVENCLRDAGLSISMSKKYASLIKSDLSDSEEDEQELDNPTEEEAPIDQEEPKTEVEKSDDPEVQPDGSEDEEQENTVDAKAIAEALQTQLSILNINEMMENL